MTRPLSRERNVRNRKKIQAKLVSRSFRLGFLCGVVGSMALGACKNESDLSSKNTTQVVENPPDPPVYETQDRIIQRTTPTIDVLFVVDNSPSMVEEQINLATNFPIFMEYFLGSGLDYHIGVVSMDMDDIRHRGQLRTVSGVRYIDSSTPDPVTIFDNMTRVGTEGTTQEQGREAAWTAIQNLGEGTLNEGFYRPESALHFVFVSDEDDSSHVLDDNPGEIEANEFIDWMLRLKWSPDLVKAHSIVAPEGECAEAFQPGLQYLNYSAETGGLRFSVCWPDWGMFLEQLGVEVTGLRKEFFLTQIPLWETIDIEVRYTNELGNEIVQDDFPVCIDFEEGCRAIYNPGRNAISFVDYTPPQLAEVVIDYTLLDKLDEEVFTEDF